MHVLHVIDSLAGGGAERMLVDIANCTATRGIEVSVCQTRSNGILSKALNSGIKVFALGRVNRFDFSTLRSFAAWVSARDVDLIHVHGRTSLLFLSAATVVCRFRRPTVFHDHYGKIDIDKSVPIWLRFAARNVSRYVGVSQQSVAWAIGAGFDRNSVSCMTNYLDLSRFESQSHRNIRCKLQLSDDVALGVVVCGLRPEKGIDVLLHAISSLDIPNFKLVIVGGEAAPGYMEMCKSLAGQLGVSADVIFVGQMMDIPAYLSSFDFAVMPSISESGPLVLIEYLVSGLPIVATRTGQVSAEVESAGIGSFVDPGDIAGLSKAIADMVALRREERTAIGSQGIEVAKEHFDLRRKIDQWLKVYSEVMRDEPK